jgi:hypothetical protein
MEDYSRKEFSPQSSVSGKSPEASTSKRAFSRQDGCLEGHRMISPPARKASLEITESAEKKFKKTNSLHLAAALPNRPSFSA